MHLTYTNVNHAFRDIMQGFSWGVFPHSRTDTRNGACYTIHEPVLITYTSPKERVLWNATRDANPFFHVMEALWMLAGRNDVETVAWFADNIRNYSDDGKTFHAPYGHRWYYLAQNAADREGDTPNPYSPGYIGSHNQLVDLITLLREQPTTRRAVLSMWDPLDLHKVVKEPSCKDVACNTHAYFQLVPIRHYRRGTFVDGREVTGSDIIAYRLDMTVCNRSNDVLWGALGANYVHMSFLLEYIAACVDSPEAPVRVGVYNQFTNNLHLYCEKDATAEWLKDETPDYYSRPWTVTDTDIWNPVELGRCPIMPLVQDPTTFQREVHEAVDYILQVKNSPKADRDEFKEPFLEHVFRPMLYAWYYHKTKNYPMASWWSTQIGSPDWELACRYWLSRRERRHLEKINAKPATAD